jgi:hypothetical protein
MTLTVRLKPELETALELHCAERGVTKSLVVQEVLAEYLVRPPTKRNNRRPAAAAESMPAEPSDNYKAFERLGLIGAVSGVGPADKAGVRAAFDRWAEAKRKSWAASAPDLGPGKNRQPRPKRKPG